MSKLFKKTVIILFILLAVLTAVVLLYVQQDKFGAKPTGERLERMKKSPNYRDGAFHNLSHTPMLSAGHSYWGIFYQAIFKSSPRKRPEAIIPSVKTDLKSIAEDSNVLVWFGHSSYYLQIDGKRFLVDPVFSGNASPVAGTGKAFKGTDVYTVEDLPNIDYLIITHDHYDHLDYETLLQLKGKIRTVICGLGVGAHFEKWNFEPGQIIEKDWYEKEDLGGGFVLFTEPARHFSGRVFKRNNTLWASYVLQTPGLKIYLGGDSGYDTHYAAIGKKHGPIDLAILDNGQYDDAWREIHNHPLEVLQAAKDLSAKRILPVHSSKFALGNHAWDEPLKTLTECNEKDFYCPILTPKIGEPVYLNDLTQVFSEWWREVRGA